MKETNRVRMPAAVGLCLAIAVLGGWARPQCGEPRLARLPEAHGECLLAPAGTSAASIVREERWYWALAQQGAPAPLTLPGPLLRPDPGPPPIAGPLQQTPTLCCSAFEHALHWARRCRTRAVIAASRQLEALDEWDPSATNPMVRGSIDMEAWRLQQMARDQGGDLHRAWVQAERAAALARSRGQACRVVELLTIIEHEMGHHQAELKEARLLAALEPRQVSARLLLRRAAVCSGYRRRRQPASRTLAGIAE